MPSNAIRVVPWRHRWRPTDVAAFRAAYADGGRAGLAREVAWRLAGVVRGRATDPYERSVLIEWLDETTPDEIAAWTDLAERGDWPSEDEGV